MRTAERIDEGTVPVEAGGMEAEVVQHGHGVDMSLTAGGVVVEPDVPPGFRTVLRWNFPLMIPLWGEGEFHEEVEVFGGPDCLHSAPGG